MDIVRSYMPALNGDVLESGLGEKPAWSHYYLTLCDLTELVWMPTLEFVNRSMPCGTQR